MKTEIDVLEIVTEKNRFNVAYRSLSEAEQKLIRDMKGTAAILATFIGQNNNRESSIAMTNLETAIMWAVKGVCAGLESE